MGREIEKDLTPSERIAVLNDSWASVRVGEQQIGDFLALAEGLRADRTRAVMAQMTLKLDYIATYLVSDADRAGYEQWVRRLLAPAAKELGWRPKPGESDETKSLRARVLYTLGYAGQDPEVIASARRWTEKALVDPASLDSTVAFTAFTLAAQHGDASFYDKLMTKMQASGTSLENYYLYFQTLSKFRSPKLLERTLEYAISPAVRSQDTLGMIAAVMKNPAGGRLAWEFVQAHWSEIDKVGGGLHERGSGRRNQRVLRGRHAGPGAGLLHAACRSNRPADAQAVARKHPQLRGSEIATDSGIVAVAAKAGSSVWEVIEPDRA